MSNRQKIVRNCKKHGLRVQPAVLKDMLLLQGDNDNFEETLEVVLSSLKQKLAKAPLKLITPALWKEAIDGLDNEKDSNDENSGFWNLIDAFDQPKLVYNSLQQNFYVDDQAKGNKRPPLLGTAKDKLQMMAQRYLQIQQRTARQLVQTPLITIDRLLGSCDSTTKQVLLGMLHRTPSGFELEDMTGTITILFTDTTQLDPSALYTEGSFVLVQGTYNQETLIVDRMGMPLIESKAESTPLLPLAKREEPKSPLAIYSMANLALDQPESIQQLEELIDVVNDGDDRETILVLMGNFTTESLTFAAALDELSRILEDTNDNVQVLIQPGPNDTPSLCWPLPKPQQHVQTRMPSNVQFISNPCRLQYGNHDVVISRQDLIRRHLDQQIVSVRSDDPLVSRMIHTVLSQGHLASASALPIYWNYDHSLSLYPLPDLVLLGLEDEGSEAFEFSKVGCHVAAPGSGWAKVTLGGSSSGARRGGSDVGGGRGQHPSTQIELSQDFDEDIMNEA